jgi:hypothetical protein
MGKAEGKKNTKMGFKQMGKDTDWINLAQDTDSVLALLHMVTNLAPWTNLE